MLHVFFIEPPPPGLGRDSRARSDPGVESIDSRRGAVVFFAWGVFFLGVAVVLAVAHKPHVGVAVIAAIALAAVGGGMAIAGAIRWRDCHGNGSGVVHGPGGICPNTTFGLRDPF